MPVIGEDLTIPFTVGENSLEPFAERLIERLKPWMTADLELYCRAIAAPFETFLRVCEETGTQGEAGWVPGWSTLLDPLTCPDAYLAYLAMFVGTSIPKTSTEAEARNLVLYHCNFNRGTLYHLEYAIEEALGAGVPFQVLERTNPETGLEDAYAFTVIIPKGKSSQTLINAINKAKPGGVMFQPIVEVENAWIEAGKTWEEAAAGKEFTNIKEGEY